MKIVSCFMNASEIEPLLKAGADELYTAVPGIPSFDDDCLSGIAPEKAVRRIHSLGGRALIAANAHDITLDSRGMRRLADRIFALDKAGADAFIIASPSLLSLLRSDRRRLRADIHLSSVQPCFNTAALRFFLGLGVRRLILPTHLSPFEARPLLDLCRRSGVETEIFDYRFFGCVYVNGRCNLHVPRFHTFRKGVHGGALCRCGESSRLLPVRPSGVSPGREKEAAILAARVSLRMGSGGAPRIYNAASFYDFFRLGVGWLKYGVRKDPGPVKAAKVAMVRDMRDLAAGLTRKLGPSVARRVFIERMLEWNRR